MEQIYTPKQNYRVLVRCFTYNQSKYIEDALNGFAMQQTHFPFVCLVMDDCSTDGEQEVIKAWMERECDMEKAEYIEIELSNIILVPHKSNANCTFVFYFLKQNLYGTGKKMPLVTPWREHCEFEAMCEGDDYWIDPLKLQTQVYYLDKNPNSGLCRTNVQVFYQKKIEFEGDLMSKQPFDKNDDTLAFYVVFGYYAAPCTWLIRTKYLDKMPHLDSKKYFTGDILTLLHISSVAYIHYINNETAVYRILEESASHFSSIGAKYNFYLKNKRTRLLYLKTLSLKTRIEFIMYNTMNLRPQGCRDIRLWVKYIYDTVMDSIKALTI